MSDNDLPRSRTRQPHGELRIIGGRFRGRKLRFPALGGLRPTPSRVRETLFNWLKPVIEGARCLDLFAGSGALGIEALSRGAAKVVFVDKDARVIRNLKENLDGLSAIDAELVQADSLTWLDRTPRPFDIVLLDPPFDSDLLTLVCEKLNDDWLVHEGLVYLETDHRSDPVLPADWDIIRAKSASRVSYKLAVKRG